MLKCLALFLFVVFQGKASFAGFVELLLYSKSIKMCCSVILKFPSYDFILFSAFAAFHSFKNYTNGEIFTFKLSESVCKCVSSVFGRSMYRPQDTCKTTFVVLPAPYEL